MIVTQYEGPTETPFHWAENDRTLRAAARGADVPLARARAQGARHYTVVAVQPSATTGTRPWANSGLIPPSETSTVAIICTRDV